MLCRPCRAAELREARRQKAIDRLPEPPAPRPPNPAPAITLRQALDARRRTGLPWSDEAFEALVREAVNAVPGREAREDWRVALRGMQHVWEAAYLQRNGQISPLSRDLLD